MLDSFVKRYTHPATQQNPDCGFRYATAVRHQGRVISLALGVDATGRPRIHYTVLDAAASAPSGPTGAGQASTRDADGWSATPTLLPFPAEIAQVGYGVTDQTVLPVYKRGASDPELPGAAVPVAERDEFRSTTARLTAAQPFHVMSDGQHVYVFRQSVDASDPNNVVKRFAPRVTEEGTATSLGDEVFDASGNPVPLVDSTLLVDRFLLTGSQLVNVREVRFQRSRSKTRPASRRDGLGDRDLDGVPFVEPTQELAFVNRLRDGRFAALLVPTLVAGIQRWHVMTHNDRTGRIDLYSVERSSDGLFNPRGTQFYTSPDPEHRGDVFEARPGKDPFTGEDLVPFVEPSDYAESALRFDGSSALELDAGIDLPGSFAVEMWIRPARPGGKAPQRLIGAGKTLGGARRTTDTPPSVWIEEMNRLRIGFGSASVWMEHLTPRILKVDVWTHVAISFDGSVLRTYVDGRLRDLTEDAEVYEGGSHKISGDDPVREPLAGHTPGAPLAAVGGRSEGFEGSIDEIRVWSRSRGTRELGAQRGVRLVGNELGLAAYWRCDEASGDRVFDQTDNRRDASVVHDAGSGGVDVWITSDAPVSIGTGLTRNSFVIGSDDGQGGTAIHTVETGLSAVLYHEQTNVASGYDGTSKRLKQSARVMLAVGTKARGGTRTEIATVDLGVAATGQLAQVPDVVELGRIESGSTTVLSLNDQLDGLARLERKKQDLVLEHDRLVADAASLRPVLSHLENVLADPEVFVPEITVPGYEFLNALIADYVAAARLQSAAQGDLDAFNARVAATQATFYLNVGYDTPVLWLGIGTHRDLGTASKQISSFQLPAELQLEVEADAGAAYRFVDSHPNLVNVAHPGGNLNDRITAIHLAASDSADLERDRLRRVVAEADETVRAARAPLEAARTEIDGLLVALAARTAEVVSERQTTESRLSEARGILHQGARINTKHVAMDARGLTILGGILAFAWTVDTPRLFDSAMGRVALYFRGEADQYFAAYYSTFIDLAKYVLTDRTGSTALTCSARSSDPDLDNIVIHVQDGATEADCTIIVRTPDVEETWTHVSRTASVAADVLNGTASVRKYVGRGVAERTDGQVVAVSFPDGIGSACAAGATLVVGNVAVLVTDPCEANASRVAVSAPDGPVPLDLLPVYYLPYDYDRHASTTKIPSDLYNGSLLVVAMANDESALVSNQQVVSGTTLSGHWIAEAPGSTLSFDGKATHALPESGASLPALDVGDDLTIEGWVRPADVGERMRIIRHKTPQSEYSMGVEPVRRALLFDGANDAVDHKSQGLDPGQDWTVALWFRADRTDGVNYLFNKDNYAAAVRDGFLHFLWGGQSWRGEQSFPVSPGRWYHLALVRRGGTVAMYRNGVKLSVLDPAVGAITPTSFPLVFGAASATTGHFAGALSGVRIWKAARSDAQIAGDRDGNLDTDDAELVGAWAYEEIDGDRVLSLTAQRRHGHVIGAPKPIVIYDVFAGVNGRYGQSRVGFEAGHWVHLAAAFTQSYAVELGGGTAHLSCPHSPELDLAGDLTIEGIITPHLLQLTQGLIAKGEVGGDEPVPYALGLDPQGHLLFTVVDADGATHSVRSDRALSTATHRFAVTRRRRSESLTLGELTSQTLYTIAWDDVTFFVDGRPAGTHPLTEHGNVVRAFLAVEAAAASDVDARKAAFQTAAGGSTRFDALSLRGNDKSLELGRWTQSGVPGAPRAVAYLGFHGVVSELRLSNRALDADQIGSTGTAGDGLVALWVFEERKGTVAHDVAGTNHATFSGTVTWRKDPDPDRASLVLYQNGEPIPAYAASGGFAGAGVEQSTVGALRRSRGAEEYFRGEVDELRIWQVARSEEQIQDNLFRRLVEGGQEQHVLAGEDLDLVAYYSFDARIDTKVADKGPRGNHLRLESGSHVLSTAPVGVDAPHIRSALAGVKTPFHGTVHSSPGVAEYADVAYDGDGNVVGTFKRCYVSVERGEWQLVSGFKVGDLTTDWIGQIQFAPQLIGYIEGAPPVPSENLTATGYVRGEFAEYVDASGVELTQATSVNRRYAAEKETGTDLSVDFKLGGIIGAHAEAGLFLVVESLDVENVIGFHGNFETSWGYLAETSTTVGRSTTQELSMALRGSVENENAIAYPAVGRRFVPDNVGMAFVTSETADLFALRLAHNGALVSFQIRPNPDIPPDQNIITFPINPRYTKQGALDGKVGFEPDLNYPNALTYSSDLSYFKPIEAYALRNRIDEETAARRTRYLQYDAAAIGRQAPSLDATLESRLTSPTAAEHKRSLVNRYVWTADGGLFAESEETLLSRSETLGGSYSFKGMGGLYTDLTFAVFGLGFKFELDLLFGGHLDRTVTKSEEVESTFALSVDLGGVESDTYMRNARGELVMDRRDPRNPKPKRQPGRVDAYRFMSFYLEPSADAFDTFFNKVVDPIWLEQSSDPAAAALREARQDAKRPPAWRIMHRVTYVSRVLPEFSNDAPASLEKSLRNLEIDSNYELIRLLEPFVIDHLGSDEEFALAVDGAVGTYVPELKPHLSEMRAYLRLYFGVGSSAVDLEQASLGGGRALDQAPVVNAGIDQVVGLAGSKVGTQVSGNVIDDRYDKAEAIFATWEAAEGPAPVRFEDAHSAETTAEFTARGRFTLRLTADDGRLSAADELDIVVNEPPIADAGPRQGLRPASGAELLLDVADDDPARAWIEGQLAADPDRAICRLAGRVVDDGLGDPDTGVVTTRWDKVSGAGDIALSADNRFASFSRSGHYTLRFSVDNETFAVDSQVVVEVAARVSAGLLALYTFQEGSGDALKDVAGVRDACDLRIADGGTYVRTADALEFTAPSIATSDGPCDRINQSLAASGELTVEAWVQAAEPSPDGLRRIVTLSTGSEARNLTLGQTEDALHLAVRTTETNANASDVALTVPGTIVAGLHQIAATRWADGRTHVYVDGEPVAERTLSGDLTPWDETAVLAIGNEIGAGPDAGTAFLGTLHLVALYDRALAAEEIDQNWRYGADTDLPPVVDAGTQQVVDAEVLPAIAVLAPHVVHDRPPDDEATAWVMVSGPADADFDDATSPAPQVTLPVTGRYRLRLSVEAGGAMTSDEMELIVNTAPIIAAPRQIDVTLPDSLDLVGEVLDDGLGEPSQGTVSARWTPLDVPAPVVFSDAASLATNVRFGGHGPHTLQLEVNNGHFTSVTDVAVRVYAVPRISASVEEVVTLSGGSASFDLVGAMEHAGLGDPAAQVTLAWSQVSGPAPATIAGGDMLAATATAVRNGDYVFEMRVDNGKLSATVQVGVTVNQAPSVDAGVAASVVLPEPVTLDATAGDDGLPHDPGRFVVRWEHVSGPGLVLFDDAASDRTAARFTFPGRYQLRVSADDGAATSSDSVEIDVQRPPRVAEDLVVHYRFDAEEGISVADVAGIDPALHLDIPDAATATWVAGGLHLDGAGALVAAASAQRVLDALVAGGGTIEAVVTPGDNMVFRRTVARVFTLQDEWGPIVSLSQDGEGMRGALHFDRGRRRTSQSVGAALGDSQARVQVAYSFDPASKTVALYLNGLEVGAGTYGGAWPPGSVTQPVLAVGGDSGGTPWVGTLHAVAVYGHTLSANEVLTNYYADIG